MTMQVIQHIELGSAAANITFSSIPQTYTDLLVVMSLRSTSNFASTYDFLNMNINSASTNFSSRLLQGSGSGVGSFTSSNTQIAILNGSNSTASTFSSHNFYMPNYTSGSQKSFSVETVHETNATEAYQQIWAGLWPSTAAVSSFVLTTNSAANFAAGSSATLYGITKGSDGTTTVS